MTDKELETLELRLKLMESRIRDLQNRVRDLELKPHARTSQAILSFLDRNAKRR